MKLKKNFLMFLVMLFLMYNLACDFTGNDKQITTITSDTAFVTGKETQKETTKINVFDSFREISIMLNYPITRMNAQDLSANLEMRIDGVREYMEKVYGIIVNIDMVKLTDYESERSTRLLSGDGTDIYCIGNPEVFYFENIVGNVTIDYVYTADLTDFIGQYYPEVRYMMELNPELESVIVQNERILAVPGCTSMPMDLYALIFNKKIYELDKNKYLTADDIVEIYTKMSEIQPDYYGICNFRLFINLALPNELLDGFTIVEDFHPVLLEESIAFKDIFTKYGKICNASSNMDTSSFTFWDGVWLDPSVFGKQKSIEDFKSLKVAPAIELVNYSSFRNSVMSVNNSSKFNECYDIIPVQYKLRQPKICYGPKYYISVYSVEIEASLTFLRCLEYDQTVYDFMRYGVKDVDYVETNEGLILNNTYTIKNIFSPRLDRKLAHDFIQWDDFLSEYMKSQSQPGIDDEYWYSLSVQSVIEDLLKNNQSFANIVKSRRDIYNGIYRDIRGVSADTAYNNFLNKFDVNDSIYMIDEIILNIKE
ncbi:MAG TPA: hypothetical protein DDZ89_05750 [Clostridiales bacterium]|nr:hypothetical protein [Clostridiales bacterium]